MIYQINVPSIVHLEKVYRKLRLSYMDNAQLYFCHLLFTINKEYFSSLNNTALM